MNDSDAKRKNNYYYSMPKQDRGLLAGWQKTDSPSPNSYQNMRAALAVSHKTAQFKQPQAERKFDP